MNVFKKQLISFQPHSWWYIETAVVDTLGCIIEGVSRVARDNAQVCRLLDTVKERPGSAILVTCAGAAVVGFLCGR